MQIEIQHLSHQLQELRMNMQYFANHLGDASFEGSSANAQKIQELEKEIHRVKHAQVDDKYSLTALVGMFPQGTKQKDAEAWLAEKCQSLHIAFSSSYIKGTEFKGIVFLKFNSSVNRDYAIDQFQKAQLQFNSSRMWMSADKPIEVRIPLQILRNIRKELISWDFSASSLWVDESNVSLCWNGDYVMSVQVHNSSLQIAFGATWEEFLADSSLKELLHKGNASLQQSLISRAKGKGLGKGKNKNQSVDHSVFGVKPEDY